MRFLHSSVQGTFAVHVPPGTVNLRPWTWNARENGGAALTRLGSEVDYDIRLSRYDRLSG
jgi:hypothetical protein